MTARDTRCRGDEPTPRLGRTPCEAPAKGMTMTAASGRILRGLTAAPRIVWSST